MTLPDGSLKTAIVHADCVLHYHVHVVTYDVVGDSDVVCKASGSTHIKEIGA